MLSGFWASIPTRSGAWADVTWVSDERTGAVSVTGTGERLLRHVRTREADGAGGVSVVRSLSRVGVLLAGFMTSAWPVSGCAVCADRYSHDVDHMALLTS
jgi:hypothetical protein